MHRGRFREELYYRINGVLLRLPPLRNRKEDIPALLDFFLKKYASLFARPVPEVSPGGMQLLLDHSWPGNIRELENVARKMVAFGDEQLALHDLSAVKPLKSSEALPRHANSSSSSSISRPSSPSKLLRNDASPIRSLKEAAREASRHAERTLILSQLERTHWNRKRTARELQISYKALLYKLKQLGLVGSSPVEE
jgi:two-component system response regulator AtoC